MKNSLQLCFLIIIYIFIVCVTTKYIFLENVNNLVVSSRIVFPKVTNGELNSSNSNVFKITGGEFMIDSYYLFKGFVNGDRKEFVILIDPRLFSSISNTNLGVDDYALMIPHFNMDGLLDRIKLNYFDKSFYYSILKYYFGVPIQITRELLIVFRYFKGTGLNLVFREKTKRMDTEKYNFDINMFHYFWLLCELAKENNVKVTISYFEPRLTSNLSFYRILVKIKEQVEQAQKEYPNHITIKKIIDSNVFNLHFRELD